MRRWCARSTARTSRGSSTAISSPRTSSSPTSGTMKVLDFGIAKVLKDEPRGAEPRSATCRAPRSRRRRPAARRAQRDHRHHGVHVARAVGHGRRHRPPHRHLGDRHHAVPDARRAPSARAAGRRPATPFIADLDQPMPSLRDVAPRRPARRWRTSSIAACASARRSASPTRARCCGRWSRSCPGASWPGTHQIESGPYAGLRSFQEEDAGRFFGRAREIAAHGDAHPRAAADGGGRAVGRRQVVVRARRPRAGAQGLGREVGVAGGAPGPRAAAGAGGAAGAAGRQLGQPGRRSRRAEGAGRAPDRRAGLPRQRAAQQHAPQGTSCCSSSISSRSSTRSAPIRPSGARSPPASPASPTTRPRRCAWSSRCAPTSSIASPRIRTSWTSWPGALLPGAAQLRGLARRDRAAGRAGRLPVRDAADGRRHARHLAATPGALPLLQFAAAKLWEARDPTRKLLTEQSYTALGGIAGALASHADRVIAELTPEARALARSLFLRLVTAERTRAVGIDELRETAADKAEVDRLVDQLVEARLLVVQTGGGSSGATVEIVHESLIQSWPTLRRWLDESQEDSVFLEQLRAAARQWQGKGRDSGLLWRGEVVEELARFQRRYRGELAEIPRAFLKRSSSRTRRGARRRRGAGDRRRRLSGRAAGGGGGRAGRHPQLAEAGRAELGGGDAGPGERAAPPARGAGQGARAAARRGAQKVAQKEAASANTKVEMTNEELAKKNVELKGALDRAKEQRGTPRRPRCRPSRTSGRRARPRSRRCQSAQKLEQALKRERERADQVERAARRAGGAVEMRRTTSHLDGQPRPPGGPREPGEPRIAGRRASRLGRFRPVWRRRACSCACSCWRPRARRPRRRHPVRRAAASPAAPAAVADDRPWAVGVSPERQKIALERLQEGNALVKESLFLASGREVPPGAGDLGSSGHPLQPGPGAAEPRPAAGGPPASGERAQVWAGAAGQGEVRSRQGLSVVDREAAGPHRRPMRRLRRGRQPGRQGSLSGSRSLPEPGTARPPHRHRRQGRVSDHRADQDPAPGRAVRVPAQALRRGRADRVPAPLAGLAAGGGHHRGRPLAGGGRGPDHRGRRSLQHLRQAAQDRVQHGLRAAARSGLESRTAAIPTRRCPRWPTPWERPPWRAESRSST